MPTANLRNLGIAALLLALLLNACNLPAAALQDTSPEAPSVAYTAAAETIVAQLTELAKPNRAQPGTPEGPSPNGGGNPSTATPSPTPEPSATPTLEASATPTLAPTATTDATPTLASQDPKASLGSPSWQDTFRNANNWPLYDDDHVEMRLDDGELVMTALQADKWDSWMISWPEVADFYLEGVFTTGGECSGRDHYGLLARAPSGNEGYLFGVSCGGEYSLRTWDGDNFSALVSWTASDAIVKGQGQTNRLGFWANGEQIRLYANGKLLAEVEDDRYDAGALGPFVGAAETPEFEVRISEMAYWELP